MTVDSSDNPMFSAGNSPESSIDSDIYNSVLDSTSNSSRNRLKTDEDHNTMNNVTHHIEGNGPTLMELSSEQGNSYSERMNMNNKHPAFNVLENSNCNDKIGLKTIETQPFSPHTNWSGSQKSDFELPDLDETSQSHIPCVEETRNHISDFKEADCTPSSSNGIFSRYQSNVSSSAGLNSSIMSSTVNSTDFNNVSEKLEKSNFNGFGSGTQKCKVGTNPNENINTVSSLSETLNISGLKWDLRSAASPKSEDGSVHSNKSDSIRTGSPSRLDKSERESRPSTPKVPPLKIIIPAKSTSSSAVAEVDKLKVHVAKSALPYVINPTQDQQKAVAETSVVDSQTGDIPGKPVSVSRASSPGYQPRRSPRRSPSPVTALRRSPRRSPSPTPREQTRVEESSDSKLIDSDNIVLDSTSGDNTDTVVKLSETKDGTKSEADSKKEESTEKRVLRSSVRSQAQTQPKQQQQKQEKLDKLEKSSKYRSSFSAGLVRNYRGTYKEFDGSKRTGFIL